MPRLLAHIFLEFRMNVDIASGTHLDVLARIFETGFLYRDHMVASENIDI